jgi:sugar lactone lactonase YvrE
MPYHFFRATDGPNNNSRPFGTTSVPNDTSFSRVSTADFLVFDYERGIDLLGSNATYEYVFEVSNAVHEGPVFVAAQNKLYFSQLSPGYLPQLVIDLNVNPPTLTPFVSNPPVYAPNGGTFHNGKIYWAASGGINSLNGSEHRVGIVTLDPATGKTEYLLNNYYGFYFNTIDDLFVHPNGDVWFTDPSKSTKITLHMSKHQV